MRLISVLLSLVMCTSVIITSIGCADNTTPILAYGRIMTEEDSDDDDDYNNYNNYNPDGHAYVRIIKTSDNSVIAETKVSDIQVLPQPYQIRMKYNEAFTDYWSGYAIECKYYNSAEDNTVDMQCRQEIDIRSYDRLIDLIIE